MNVVVVCMAFFQILLLLLSTKKESAVNIVALQTLLKDRCRRTSTSWFFPNIKTTKTKKIYQQQQQQQQYRYLSQRIGYSNPLPYLKSKNAASAPNRFPFSEERPPQLVLQEVLWQNLQPRSHQDDDDYAASLGFVVSHVESSLRQLMEGVSDVTGSDGFIENVSTLIVASMMQENRRYHRIYHVVEIVHGLERNKNYRKLSKESQSIAVLAALYHDVVYVQVDEGVSPRVAEILLLNNDSNTTSSSCGKRGGIIRFDTGFRLEQGNSEVDPLLRMVESVFDLYEHGRQQNLLLLPNEFLSAVVAVRQLQPILPMSRLAQIAACIEATIPFRGRTATSARLYDNLHRTNEIFHLGLSKSELLDTVHCAVGLANEDASNFGGDFDTFLSNTASLLFESHPSLRQPSQYNPGDLIVALEKMVNFFDVLQPHMIFHQFCNVPLTVELMRQERVASTNLRRARLVLQDLIDSSILLRDAAASAREE